MIDTAQAVLLLVVVVLTSLLVVLGIQVFFILREIRRTISKANEVLDNTASITQAVTGPISALSTITAGLKTGSIIGSILNRKKRIIDKVFGDEDEEEEGKNGRRK